MAQVCVHIEEGFIDINFPIISIKTNTGGIFRITTEGLFEEKVIGFEMDIIFEPEKNFGPKFDFSKCTGPIIFRSLGPKSDQFLMALAKIYYIPLKTGKMVDSVSFPVLSLNSEEVNDFSKTPASMKLFYESDEPDCSAEFYTNIDFQKKMLQFNEKDPECRAPIINAFLVGNQKDDDDIASLAKYKKDRNYRDDWF